jgi:hypothetical protein
MDVKLLLFASQMPEWRPARIPLLTGILGVLRVVGIKGGNVGGNIGEQLAAGEAKDEGVAGRPPPQNRAIAMRATGAAEILCGMEAGDDCGYARHGSLLDLFGRGGYIALVRPAISPLLVERGRVELPISRACKASMLPPTGSSHVSRNASTKMVEAFCLQTRSN